MKIKEISIGKATTLNLGNFESIKVQANLVADVNEDDDLNIIVTELKDKLDTILLDMIEDK
jgi:hypothetical protein